MIDNGKTPRSYSLEDLLEDGVPSGPYSPSVRKPAGKKIPTTAKGSE